MHEARWMPKAELTAWHHFIEASQLLERLLDRELRRRFRLAHVQYEILVRLAGTPERRMRMTELADRLVTAKSSLTYQIAQLEQRGLVTREGTVADGRGVYATITGAGLVLLDQVVPAHLGQVRRYLLDPLTAEQVATVSQVLGACRDRLRATDAAQPASD